MNTYCFNVQKKCEDKVLVHAESLQRAYQIMNKSIEKVDFSNPINIGYSFCIDKDSCNEDDTFDEEQFSMKGCQVFE